MSGGTDKGGTISKFAKDTASAYREMEMDGGRYATFVVLPATVVLLIVVGVLVVVRPPAIISAPVGLFGIFAVIVAAVYPKISLENRKTEINEKFHLYITHMTVLSTTNIDRVEVFRKLSNESEYGELATETRRIVETVETWNQSLDDACRKRAEKVPSDIMSDFLDRLAYVMGAGDDLGDFLMREQETMVDEYTTMYEGNLGNLDVLKDLYLSMILSMAFGLVFAIILPILTGTDPVMVVGIVVLIFGFVQAGFLYAIKVTVPFDPVWYFPDDEKTRAKKIIQITFGAAVVLSVPIGAFVAASFFGLAPFPFDAFSPELYLAATVAPFLIPGLLTRRIEKKVKRRDEVYPDFIRGLGSVESAKQTTTTAVLSDLREKDFGKLTPQIDNLYKRLRMRIEPEGAWRRFMQECGSYLIQKFSGMYLVGREMGGDPRQLGELINKNFNTVLQLREHRNRMTVTIIGVLYGMTASMSFALFLGVEIVKILTDVSSEFDLSQMGFGQLLHPDIYNIQIIRIEVIAIVFLNAVMSSLMIRMVDGGHKANSSLHFVALTWMGCGIGIATGVVAETVINV